MNRSPAWRETLWRTRRAVALTFGPKEQGPNGRKLGRKSRLRRATAVRTRNRSASGSSTVAVFFPPASPAAGPRCPVDTTTAHAAIVRVPSFAFTHTELFQVCSLGVYVYTEPVSGVAIVRRVAAGLLLCSRRLLVPVRSNNRLPVARDDAEDPGEDPDEN
jgi:hypothetical protein